MASAVPVILHLSFAREDLTLFISEGLSTSNSLLLLRERVTEWLLAYDGIHEGIELMESDQWDHSLHFLSLW
jgi:hypothetical protein